jgi:hypothetical protein
VPKGKAKKLFPGMYSGQEETATPPASNDQITNILAPGDEESFSESLPESTATMETDKPKRKRRTRAEIDAANGELDPLMSDARYKQAVGNMAGFGGARVIKTLAKLTGKPLDAEEEQDVDDLFYVIAKRSKLDPGASWTVLIIYAVFLVLRLIGVRTDAGKVLKQMFEPKADAQNLPKAEGPVN